MRIMSYEVIDRVLMNLYFKMIQEEPEGPILDIGMFLKRIGAVSRRVLDIEIPESTILHGVDVPGTPAFPLYEKIYDRIWPSFVPEETRYSLCFFLRPQDLYSEKEREVILSWCASHCDKTVTEEDVSAFGRTDTVQFVNRRYYVLLGE